MIFGQDHVSCDDFDDCHDVIAVAGVDFIGRRLSCGHYLQGEGVLLGAPRYFGSSISSSLVTERKSWFRGDEFASYAAPNNGTDDILSSIHMHFEFVPKRWILHHVQCFGVGHWIRHKSISKRLV
jgi:hypothetical protein